MSWRFPVPIELIHAINQTVGLKLVVCSNTSERAIRESLGSPGIRTCTTHKGLIATKLDHPTRRCRVFVVAVARENRRPDGHLGPRCRFFKCHLSQRPSQSRARVLLIRTNTKISEDFSSLPPFKAELSHILVHLTSSLGRGPSNTSP